MTQADRPDIFAVCAQRVLERFKDELDLSKVLVLVPDMLHTVRLTRHLRELSEKSGRVALIPPLITTPRNLAVARTPRSVMSGAERHLILGDALVDHPELFKNLNRWQFSEALLQLFDELNLREEITDASLFSDESRYLLSVRRAWLDYMRGHVGDETEVYREQLVGDTLSRPDEHVFLCGFEELSPLEQGWAGRMEEAGRLTRIEHAPAGAFRATLDAYIRGRAPEDATVEARERLRIFMPGGLEEHAQGVVLAVQRWLDEGVSPINIVAQDRRLARRLRALFADRGVILRDRSGWAFSTSASATALYHLIEDLPPADLFLKLVRSAFVSWSDADAGGPASGDIERALIRHGQPVETWRELEQCLHKHQAEEAACHIRRVREALRPLEEAAAKDDASYEDHFAALFHAMDALGMTRAMRADDVGAQMTALLADMRAVARKSGTRGDRAVWRTYLCYMLESKNFIAERGRDDVTLLNFKQARLSDARGLVLAGLDMQHASPTRSPLLTEQDALDLGVESRDDLMQRRLDLCLRLAEHADRSLLSYEMNDEQNTPLPWADSLCIFYARHHPDAPLSDAELLEDARLAVRAVHEPIPDDDRAPLRMPAPANKGATLDALSRSELQHAITCPYRFFANHDLALREEEETPDGVVNPVTFGQKVHRCMSALVGPTPNKGAQTPPDPPGPFQLPWVAKNREAAHQLGDEIVRHVFSRGLKESYVNDYYRRRATHFVRHCIDWLIDSTDIADCGHAAETTGKASTASGVELKGRIDLMLSADNKAHQIIDYKTGALTTQKSVKTLEEVQLPYYALLKPGTGIVSYVGPDGGFSVKGAELAALSAELANAIDTFKKDYENGAPMPAIGNDKACAHCAYVGLCRKPAWRNTPDADAQNQTERNNS